MNEYLQVARLETDIRDIKGMVTGLTRRQSGGRGEAPGRVLTRALVCKLVGAAESTDPQNIIERLYPGGSGRVSDCLRDPGAFLTRAVSSPAQTSVAGWAAELTGTTINSALATIAPMSTYAALAARALGVTFGPGKNVIRLPARTTSGEMSGGFIAEGAAIPVKKLTLAASVMSPYRMGVISTFTKEIAAHSTPEIEAVIREAMATDTSMTIDGALLDTSAATAVRPAGLLNGVVPIAATAGGGQAALVGDIGKLSEAIPRAVSVSYLMTQAMRDRALLHSPGAAALDIIVSPTLAEKTIVAIDSADLAMAEAAPDFSITEEATVVMSDSTPVENWATMATDSLYQQALIGIRYIQHVSWAMRRPSRLAEITGVTW